VRSNNLGHRQGCCISRCPRLANQPVWSAVAPWRDTNGAPIRAREWKALTWTIPWPSLPRAFLTCCQLIVSCGG